MGLCGIVCRATLFAECSGGFKFSVSLVFSVGLVVFGLR